MNEKSSVQTFPVSLIDTNAKDYQIITNPLTFITLESNDIQNDKYSGHQSQLIDDKMLPPKRPSCKINLTTYDGHL